jgi:serine/threonine-protein kinase RsbW
MEALTVPAKLDSLIAISDFVDGVARMGGLDEQAAYRLRLAVHEIAANVILHGYRGQVVPGCLDLKAVVDDDSVRIDLEDTAVPFDPDKVPLPADLDKPLYERRLGGLGIFLARQSVAEWRYEHIAGRNRNIFIVERPTYLVERPPYPEPDYR